MAVTLSDVEAAAARLAGVAHRTPVLTSRTLDELVGAEVFLKCESFQRAGAFKFRGAFNLMSQLSEEQKAAGVCAVSSGNHAQAVALSAQLLGIRARILMPSDAPAVKKQATAGYGAEVSEFDRWSMSQFDAGERFQAETGATFVPAYDSEATIAGAGTAALELFGEVPDLDTVLAPVGGGGLLAGTAVVAKAMPRDDGSRVRVIGVESSQSELAHRSLKAGERVEVELRPHLADGQMLNRLGEHTFAVIHELVDSIALVDDADILNGMLLLFDRLKLVTEPSGAIATAAALADSSLAGQRVGVMISGGNVGAQRFSELVAAR